MKEGECHTLLLSRLRKHARQSGGVSAKGKLKAYVGLVPASLSNNSSAKLFKLRVDGPRRFFMFLETRGLVHF